MNEFAVGILAAISLFTGRTEEAANILSQLQDVSDSRILRFLFGWTLYYQGNESVPRRSLESMIGDEGPIAEDSQGSRVARIRR